MSRSILVVSPRYPALSETFVWREVAGLRSRGVEVSVMTLTAGEHVAGVAQAEVCAYRGAAAVLRVVVGEIVSHPLVSMRTLLAACGDALAPGEAMHAVARGKLLLQAIAAVSAAGELRRKGVRHLHCHFAHASTSLGMYLSRQLKVSFSFVGHANDLFQRRTLLKRKLQRAAFVSCISQWHRDLYCSIYPAGAAKYRLVRCGVDTSRWTYREPRQTSRLHVISVCRLVEKKGIDALLRAVGLLAQRGDGAVAHVTIAGDGPEMSRLRQIAHELGITDCVRWLGAVANEQVRGLLGEADAFVLPCRVDSSGDRDGIPVVLMEAMACGVPVVSGDLPAIRELVIDHSTGLLVDGSPEQVAAAISRLASDIGLRRRLARAAADHVQQEFSLDVNLSRLREAIEHVAVASENGRQ